MKRKNNESLENMGLAFGWAICIVAVLAQLILVMIKIKTS